MSRPILFTVLAAIAPQMVLADNTTPVVDPVVVMQPEPIDSPELIFTLRLGANSAPAYFGSDEYEPGVDFAVGVQYLRLPFNQTIGSTDPSAKEYGFGPRGSLRYIKKRTAADNPELTGLNDIDLSIELGMGIGYTQEFYRLFADARYGFVGHNSWVGELGADVMVNPTDRLLLTLGPRVRLGDDGFTETYFGVTPAESAASGLAAFSPSGGVNSAGLEFTADYTLNDKWSVAGAARWDRLLNDAAASPITALGSKDQFYIRIGLVREFTLNF